MAVLVEPVKEKQFVLGPIYSGPYPAHLHDVVEILVLRRGHMGVKVNGTLYTLGPDTILTIFPGMVHSYETASEDAKGLFVGLNPRLLEEFHQRLITCWPVNPTVRIRECPPDLENAVSRLEEYMDNENHPLIQAYIHVLLACVFTKLELVPSAGVNKDSLVYRIMYYIQAHAQENLSLDSVAREIGVSRSHLSHLFSQKMHIRFRQLLNTIRIEKACHLLHDPQRSIKEVCFECGFENTRTFHRVFLEEQKMTPGEYREKIANGWVSDSHYIEGI